MMWVRLIQVIKKRWKNKEVMPKEQSAKVIMITPVNSKINKIFFEF